MPTLTEFCGDSVCSPYWKQPPSSQAYNLPPPAQSAAALLKKAVNSRIFAPQNKQDASRAFRVTRSDVKDVVTAGAVIGSIYDAETLLTGGGVGDISLSSSESTSNSPLGGVGSTCTSTSSLASSANPFFKSQSISQMSSSSSPTLLWDGSTHTNSSNSDNSSISVRRRYHLGGPLVIGSPTSTNSRGRGGAAKVCSEAQLVDGLPNDTSMKNVDKNAGDEEGNDQSVDDVFADVLAMVAAARRRSPPPDLNNTKASGTKKKSGRFSKNNGSCGDSDDSCVATKASPFGDLILGVGTASLNDDDDDLFLSSHDDGDGKKNNKGQSVSNRSQRRKNKNEKSVSSPELVAVFEDIPKPLLGPSELEDVYIIALRGVFDLVGLDLEQQENKEEAEMMWAAEGRERFKGSLGSGDEERRGGQQSRSQCSCSLTRRVADLVHYLNNEVLHSVDDCWRVGYGGVGGVGGDAAYVLPTERSQGTIGNRIKGREQLQQFVYNSTTKTFDMPENRVEDLRKGTQNGAGDGREASVGNKRGRSSHLSPLLGLCFQRPPSVCLVAVCASDGLIIGLCAATQQDAAARVVAKEVHSEEKSWCGERGGGLANSEPLGGRDERVAHLAQVSATKFSLRGKNTTKGRGNKKSGSKMPHDEQCSEEREKDEDEVTLGVKEEEPMDCTTCEGGAKCAGNGKDTNTIHHPIALSSQWVRGCLCGINLIWSHPSWARRGIASALVTAARSRLVYGFCVPRPYVAFSHPTDEGRALAERYSGRRDFLVFV